MLAGTPVGTRVEWSIREPAHAAAPAGHTGRTSHGRGARAGAFLPVRGRPALRSGARRHAGRARKPHRTRSVRGVRPVRGQRGPGGSGSGQQRVWRRFRGHHHADREAPRRHATRALDRRPDARDGRAGGARVRRDRCRHRPGETRGASGRMGGRLFGGPDCNGKRHREPGRDGARRTAAGDLHGCRWGGEPDLAGRQRRRAELLRRACHDGSAEPRRPDHATAGVHGPHGPRGARILGRRRGRGRGGHRRLRADHGTERLRPPPGAHPARCLRDPARALRHELPEPWRVRPAPLPDPGPRRPGRDALPVRGRGGLPERGRHLLARGEPRAQAAIRDASAHARGDRPGLRVSRALAHLAGRGDRDCVGCAPRRLPDRAHRDREPPLAAPGLHPERTGQTAGRRARCSRTHPRRSRARSTRRVAIAPS